ncbi:hypothetical protein OH77DRAFT_875925 [Trametes cingulata]|nr:hypothetical protein OH77DRAFT_875925 [Trametes cingulata]
MRRRPRRLPIRAIQSRALCGARSQQLGGYPAATVTTLSHSRDISVAPYAPWNGCLLCRRRHAPQTPLRGIELILLLIAHTAMLSIDAPSRHSTACCTELSDAGTSRHLCLPARRTRSSRATPHGCVRAHFRVQHRCFPLPQRDRRKQCSTF